MRWVTGSGRPASVLNDKELIDWVHDLSGGSYRPPERKFAGASGPLATIDVKLLKANIDKDLSKAWDFYSGQPFMWIYYDGWTNLSMVPFLGIETTFTRPDERGPVQKSNYVAPSWRTCAVRRARRLATRCDGNGPVGRGPSTARSTRGARARAPTLGASASSANDTAASTAQRFPRR